MSYSFFCISCLSLIDSLVAPLASSNMRFHSLRKGTLLIFLLIYRFFFYKFLISSSSY